MANPPVQYRFKPGQSGNPSGRKRRSFTQDDLNDLTEKYLTTKSVAELRKLAEDETLLGIDGIVVRNIMKAISSGATPADLLHYLVGKAPEVINTNITDNRQLEGVPDAVLLKVSG